MDSNARNYIRIRRITQLTSIRIKYIAFGSNRVLYIRIMKNM